MERGDGPHYHLYGATRVARGQGTGHRGRKLVPLREPNTKREPIGEIHRTTKDFTQRSGPGETAEEKFSAPKHSLMVEGPFDGSPAGAAWEQSQCDSE